MIQTLYPAFQKWSENGSIWIISDPHFDDPDCKCMDPDWLSPEEHLKELAGRHDGIGIGKNDTLICLGDVGNPEYMNQIKGYKVLIMGNHDQTATKFEPYFDEIYTGPLMIAEKIILSHEPIPDITWALNIHGHVHCAEQDIDIYHFNCAADFMRYQKVNLADIIKNGTLRYIISLHAQTINNATMRSEAKQHIIKNIGELIND